MPDTAEYLARIKANSDGDKFLEQQAATAELLRRFVVSASDAALRKSPAPGKWSVIAIIAHMAEDELVSSWRYRQMLESNGCALAGFDQDLWAKLGRYEDWSAEGALQMFTLLRDANLRMLKTLSEEEWERHGVHAERGRMTVRDLARHMAGHDRNHLEQIRRLVGQ
jgi:uncharacterized damage-inducible protein DinB